MCAALATLAPCLRAPNVVRGSFLCVQIATLAACLRAPNVVRGSFLCVQLATLAACLRAPFALVLARYARHLPTGSGMRSGAPPCAPCP